MKQLEIVEFKHSKLRYENFIWRMPKSDKRFLIITIAGDIGEIDIEHEKCCLYNHIEESRSYDYYCKTVILDFMQLEGRFIDLLPMESATISSEVGIIARNVQKLVLKSGYKGYAALEDCLSDFAFQNKRYRHDGGKQVFERSKQLHFKDHLFKYNIDKGEVKVELFKWTNTGIPFFYLKFSGYYPRGSAGSNEGHFIEHKIRELMRDFSVKGLIINFSALDYEWGDDIQIYPWQLKRIDKPLQFVFEKSQLAHFAFKLKKDENRISFTSEEARRKLELMVMKSI